MDAFRDVSALRQMVRIGLDESVERIVEEGSLDDMVFNMISHWAEPQDRINDLIVAARKANPRNQALKNVEAEIGSPSPSGRLISSPIRQPGQSDSASTTQSSVLAPLRTSPEPVEESDRSIGKIKSLDRETLSTEGYSGDFYKGPAYALVIGISQYKYGCDSQKLAPNQFPTLEFAAKDAEDFANFLSNYGFISYNVESLINQDANLIRIKGELERLRENCRQSEDPLVIVYFSGHGWVDAAERTYLIPWEAERDKLSATAFMNREFSNYLDDLPTKRLVVFLDACHSGDMGMPGVKGGLRQYDVHKDLGEAEGRYLIASCGPGQQSYEWKEKENGIFTRHLIDLLACKTDDFDEPEIDISSLYRVLSKKVKATAREVTKGRGEQEPIGPVKAGRGIILAINQRVREKRVRFLAAICVRIARPEFVYDLKPLVTEKLKSYVAKSKQFPGHNEFYRLFEGYSNRCNPDDFSRLDECVQLLIDSHQRAFDAAPVSNESPSQETKAVDKFDQVPETKVLGADKSQTVSAPTTPSDRQQARWKMSEEDRTYILEKITEGDYFKETRTLWNMLGQPVSQPDFVNKVLELGELKAGDNDLQVLLEETVKRFKKCWAKPKTNAPERLSDFLMKRR